MLKRLLIPPLLPVLLLALLAIWVMVDETRSAPRLIDDHPDNAPLRAAGILFFMAPILYVPFGILNLIDAAFDRFRARTAWIASFGISILLCGLLATIFHQPGIDASDSTASRISIVAGFLLLFPMSLLRRFALSPKKVVSTIVPGESVPFEKLFPEAADAPKLKRTEKNHS